MNREQEVLRPGHSPLRPAEQDRRCGRQRIELMDGLLQLAGDARGGRARQHLAGTVAPAK
jgi:hypothetical protein